MKMIMMLSLILSTLFINFSHPILILLVVIFQTLNMCTLIWLSSKSSWLSFVLFIIFLGGLMVLFIYITSLASNEKFEFNLEMTFYSSILLLIILFTMLSKPIDSFYSQKTTNFMELTSPLLSSTNFFIVFTLMVYLLLTLVVSVKISNKFEGPMRSTI